MKFAACFLWSGIGSIAITATFIWSFMNYPVVVANILLYGSGTAFIFIFWFLLYKLCCSIKNSEVPVAEDMIRGIHYDVDPRSESLRTPPSPPPPPPTRKR